ncbi:ATP-binding protein [Streptomyces parvulus]|uniref:ATP-binding protein n=1 Tax=Streptomyces parvulus TaxID=146923 RepID=A0ABV5D9W3_9ACTN
MRNIEISTDVNSFLSMVESLFDSPTVLLRELLQNALEATFQAVRAGAHASPIHIRTPDAITSPGDGARGVLSVSDHGVGMTEADLERSLSSVFFSGWPTGSGETLGIGKFGFGFYTVFLAADEVSVTSQALQAPDGEATSVCWSLRRDEGIARLRAAEGAPQPHGTSVALLIDPRREHLFTTESVLEYLRDAYLYAPFPVHVDGVPLGVPKVEGWRDSLFARGGGAADLMRDRFGWDEKPLHAQPVEIDGEGVLAIIPDGVPAPPVTVYRRGIKVTAEELLPYPLNYFMCGIVNVEDIELKPDRAGLRNDERYTRLRQNLFDGAKELLKGLTGRPGSTLERVFDAHGEQITRVMGKSPDLRRALGPHLPLPLYFPSPTRRHVTVAEILEQDRGRTVYWAYDRGVDQLFADRVRYLGGTSILLKDRRMLELVSSICAEQGLTLRHVVHDYIAETRSSTVSESPLTALFESVVEDDCSVLCVEDLDDRVPVKLISVGAGPAGEATGIDLSVLLDSDWRQLENDVDFFSSSLASLSSLSATSDDDGWWVVVNLRNAIIRDLSTSLEGGCNAKTLERHARIMVALAKFMAQTSIGAEQFERLNSEVLSVLHDSLAARDPVASGVPSNDGVASNESES